MQEQLWHIPLMEGTLSPRVIMWFLDMVGMLHLTSLGSYV